MRSNDQSTARELAKKDLVSKQDLERLLAQVQTGVTDPNSGLFGPESLVWQVNREALVFLAGGRAALLQLAHPYVANAIDQHSDTRENPLGRFHRTFLNVFAMVYGDLESALNAARHVHRVHTHIQGPISETLGEYKQGDLYRANEPEALLWVHATLWESSVKVFELLVRPLCPREKEQYYQETKRFAHLFGLDTVLPASWADFQSYNEDMWQKLVVGSTAREIGSFLFQPLFFGSGPVLRWLEIMTAGLMPENLRIGFGIPYGRGRQRIYRASLYALRITHRFWPKRLRFVPPYVEGLRRVSRQKKRDRIGEWLMKLWLGPLKT